MGVGLVERVSRLFGGERFGSGDEVSMSSSEFEALALGLGVPDFASLILAVLNLPWLRFTFPLPEGGVGEGVRPSLLFTGAALLSDCSACFVGEVGEVLTCFLGGVGEELPALPPPLFVGSAGSGLSVLVPVSFDVDGDFFDEALAGEAALLGDLFFSDSKVSHNVAR